MSYPYSESDIAKMARHDDELYWPEDRPDPYELSMLPRESEHAMEALDPATRAEVEAILLDWDTFEAASRHGATDPTVLPHDPSDIPF